MELGICKSHAGLLADLVFAAGLIMKEREAERHLIRSITSTTEHRTACPSTMFVMSVSFLAYLIEDYHLDCDHCCNSSSDLR